MEDAGRYRPTGVRLAVMGLFAILAIASLVILADVRLNEGGLWFEGVSGIANERGMTILLLSAEAFALAAVLMLLLIRPRPPEPVDDWVSTGGVHVGGDDTRVQIGCPGCGTVFEKPLTDVDEPHEQDFRCPNCGRQGRLGQAPTRRVDVRERACVDCGRTFKAYQDAAECPHCHAPQA